MKRTNGMNCFYFTLLIFVALGLSACTQSPDIEVNQEPHIEMYEGKSLRIAVVGKPPIVKEEQVSFAEISFDEMTNEKISSYDAVIITEENLIKAAESQYADIYLNASIPFFFIQSQKGPYPFTDKDLEYSDARDIPYNNYYATGFLIEGQEEKHWNYGLYNDEVNDENIKEMYSRLFSTIEQYSQPWYINKA